MTYEDFTLASVTAPRSPFVELARSPVKGGKLFRKQILRFGSVQHPNDPKKKLVIDQRLADSLVRNFKDGIVDIVQVPVVDEKNRHSEDPTRNIGEVIDLAVEDDGVYATIDARKSAEEIGKTLLGVSAMMHLDYTDVHSGKKVGPTLLHTAITNRPYIANLKDWEEIVAASADTQGDTPVVLAEEEETVPDLNEFSKEQLIEALRDEHGVDVEALEQASEREVPSAEEFAAALSRVLQEAGAPVALSREQNDDEPVTVKDVADAVIELSEEKTQLESAVTEMRDELKRQRVVAAEAEIDGYIQAGRVLPKQREAMIELSMEDRERFEAILPDDAVVSLSERGVETHDPAASERMEALKEDIDRLVGVADEQRGRK